MTGIDNIKAYEDATPALYDKIRFEYEYNQRSKAFLIYKYNVLPETLNDVIEAENWERKQVNASDSRSVNDFYTNVRKEFTVAVTRRQASMWGELTEIEDDVLSLIFKKLQNAKTGEQNKELSVDALYKIIKLVESIKSSSELYSEAIKVPAMADRNIKNLVESMEPRTIEELERYLKERNIPIPEIEIDDIEG